MYKQITSLLVSMSLLLGVFPAFAAEDVQNESVRLEYFTEDNVIYSALTKRSGGASSRRRAPSKNAASAVTTDFDVVLGFDMSSGMYGFDYNGEKEWIAEFKAIEEQVPVGTRFAVVTDASSEFSQDTESEFDGLDNMLYNKNSDIISVLDDCHDSFDEESDDRNNKIVYSGTDTAWHVHVYDKGDIVYSGNTWHRDDYCQLCGDIQIVSGICYYNIDFENGIGDWGNNGNGDITLVTDSGNKYMKIDYNENNPDIGAYFEVYTPSTGAYTGTQISGNIEMSFDVKFEGTDADVILKRRQPAIDNIVLRICSKETGRLMYGSNQIRYYFVDSNNSWINSLNTWFRIEISANITSDSSNAKQSIRVINKSTNEIIAEVNDADLNIDEAFCNLLLIGGSSAVDIDNITLRKTL